MRWQLPQKPGLEVDLRNANDRSTVKMRPARRNIVNLLNPNLYRRCEKTVSRAKGSLINVQAAVINSWRSDFMFMQSYINWNL